MQRLPLLTPIDKRTDDKNSVLNIRPINVLNCFSKVYENILKIQLKEKMNNVFSLLSLFIEDCTTCRT